MQLTNISELIPCDYDTFVALREAISIAPGDFDHQKSRSLSDGFLAAFPPTRAQEPLSGLWDYFDEKGMGQAWGYYNKCPGVDVIWHDSRCWLRAINADVCFMAMADIIRHVCAKYLPLVVSYNCANHDCAPGSIKGGCLKITNEGVDHFSTWIQVQDWLQTMPEAFQAPRPGPSEAGTKRIIASVRANALRVRPKSKAGTIVVYTPEPLSPIERDKVYSKRLASALAACPHSYIKGGTSWLAIPGGSDHDLIGSEIIISTADVRHTRAVLQNSLSSGSFPAGGQLQYLTEKGLWYDEWSGCRWSILDEHCRLRVSGQCTREAEAR